VIRFVFVVVLFAGMVYLLVRLIDRRNGGSAVHGPTVGRQPGPGRRSIAPDDDEQFLRDLDRRRKNQGPPPEA